MRETEGEEEVSTNSNAIRLSRGASGARAARSEAGRLSNDDLSVRSLVSEQATFVLAGDYLETNSATAATGGNIVFAGSERV